MSASGKKLKTNKNNTDLSLKNVMTIPRNMFIVKDEEKKITKNKKKRCIWK